MRNKRKIFKIFTCLNFSLIFALASTMSCEAMLNKSQQDPVPPEYKAMARDLMDGSRERTMEMNEVKAGIYALVWEKLKEDISRDDQSIADDTELNVGVVKEQLDAKGLTFEDLFNQFGAYTLNTVFSDPEISRALNELRAPATPASDLKTGTKSHLDFGYPSEEQFRPQNPLGNFLPYA